MSKTNTIPDGWKETTLGEFVTLQRGFDLPTSNRKQGNYPLLAANGQDGTHNEYKVKGPGVITGRSGTLGEVYYVKENFWPLNTTLWVKDFKNNDTKFAYYFLKTIPFERYNAGSGVPTLNRNHIHPLPVQIPQIAEQKAIAAVLSSLDNKIELLREQNTTFEAIARAIFREWFVKFNFPNENGKPYKDNNGKMIESEFGEIPDGWRVGRLRDLINIGIGGDWGKETKETHEYVQGYCLRGIDVQSLKENGFSPEAPIRWIKNSSLEKRLITENDVLIGGSGLGPIGRSIYCHPSINKIYNLPVTYSNFCKRFTANNKYRALYAEHLITNLYELGELQKHYIGTSIPNLDTNGFLEEVILVPSESMILQFAQVLDFKYETLINPHRRTLIQLRDHLLPKLMNGGVRVKF